MTSSNRMWYPTKVAEVKTRASKGHRSGQGPGEEKGRQSPEQWIDSAIGVF